MTSRSLQSTDRPFVLVNMAMTADGKIATRSRGITSFGGEPDQQHLYELRATVDAVMCGARTLESAPVTLDNGGESFAKIRRQRGLSVHPLRVAVSGRGTLSPAATLFREGSAPILVLTTSLVPRRRLTMLREQADAVWVGAGAQLDLPAALRWLRSEWQVRRLLCEGGGALNDAMFRAGLVDELHLTICPLVFGGRTAPTIADGRGHSQLADCCRLRLTSCRRKGGDWFVVFRHSE